MALAEEQVGGVWGGPTSWLLESYEGCVHRSKAKGQQVETG